MYFRNYGLEKRGSIKVFSRLFQRALRQATSYGRPNTFETWTTPPLTYSLITVRQLRWKKSPLVISRILGLLVKTLNAAHKYSLLYREKLKKLIQMQLSQKQKLFFQFVAVFLKSRLISEHFQKENDTHSWYICEITNSEKRG